MSNATTKRKRDAAPGETHLSRAGTFAHGMALLGLQDAAEIILGVMAEGLGAQYSDRLDTLVANIEKTLTGTALPVRRQAFGRRPRVRIALRLPPHAG